MIRNILPLFALVLMAAAEPGQKTEHTLKLESGDRSAPATLAEAAFLEGTWVGEGLGGQVEEVWSSAQAGAMMGMFRTAKDGKPGFYEFFLIVEDGGTLVLRLKHFNPDLTGWEEKDKQVTFRFIKTEPNKLYFDGLTYERKHDTLRVWVVMKKKDGSMSELEFTYKLKRP